MGFSLRTLLFASLTRLDSVLTSRIFIAMLRFSIDNCNQGGSMSTHARNDLPAYVAKDKDAVTHVNKSFQE